MKAGKKLGLAVIFLVLALVSVGSVAALTIKYPDLSGLKGIFSIKVITNAVIIGAAIYFALPFFGQKLESKQGMAAALILIGIVSFVLAVNIGPDHFIWQKSVFNSFKNYLFGPVDGKKAGILTYSRIGIFVGAAAIFHWFFTFLKVGAEKAKINLFLSITIGAHLARNGITGDQLIMVGEIIALFIIYNNIQATVTKKIWAFVFAAVIVESIAHILSGKSLILGVFVKKLGGFGAGWGSLLAVFGGAGFLLVWLARGEKAKSDRRTRAWKNIANLFKYHLKEIFPWIRAIWDAREDYMEGDVTRMETRHSADIELMRGLQNEFHLYQRDQLDLYKLQDFVANLSKELGEYSKWINFGGSWKAIREHCEGMRDYYKFGTEGGDVPPEIREKLGIEEGEEVKGSDLLRIEARRIEAQIQDLGLQRDARKELANKYQKRWEDPENGLRGVRDRNLLSGEDQRIYDEIMRVLDRFSVDSNIANLEMGINELTQRQSFLESRKKTVEDEATGWNELVKQYEEYWAKLDSIQNEMNPREFDQFYYFESKYRGLDPRYFMKHAINDMDRLRKDTIYGLLHSFSITVKDYIKGFERYKTDREITNDGWTGASPMDTNAGYDKRYDEEKYVISSDILNLSKSGQHKGSSGARTSSVVKRAKEFTPPKVNVGEVIRFVKESSGIEDEEESIEKKRRGDELLEASDPGMKYNRMPVKPADRGKWEEVKPDNDYLTEGGFGYGDGRDATKSIWGIAHYVRHKVENGVLRRKQQKEIIAELNVKVLTQSEEGKILGDLPGGVGGGEG